MNFSTFIMYTALASLKFCNMQFSGHNKGILNVCPYPSVRKSYVCPFVYKKFFSDLNEIWHVGGCLWVMLDRCIWPNPRSRPETEFESFHFHSLSPLPFTVVTGKWLLILKQEHNISIWLDRIFYICPTLCPYLWCTWSHNVAKPVWTEESTTVL